ncbi:MAG: disulfide bond formation protein B [Candidatus Peregrinibacteria bacterium]
MITPSTVIQALSVLTVLGQILIAVLIIGILVRTMILKKVCYLIPLFQKHGLVILFIIATIATCGSLYFSEIAGFPPCKLCWFQRIFMYAQVPLLLLALNKRDRSIAPYILLLSILGIIFSTWHYSEQIYYNIHPEAITSCDPTGVSCVNFQILAFGYITIPLMAFTAFLMNIAVSVTMIKRKI